MNLRFWRRKHYCDRCARLIEPSGCKHLWSNWDEPKTSTAPVRDGWGNRTEYSQEIVTQERRCFTCNIVERRVVVG